MLPACSTRPVTAPSTAKLGVTTERVATRVAVAKAENRATVNRIAAGAASAQLAQESLAKGELEAVKIYLNQVIVELGQANAAAARAELELTGAEVEIENLRREKGELQQTIDDMAKRAASDADVRKRVDSFFGLGAIFYGVEKLLKTGIVGILIFAGIIVALLAVGGPAGVFALRIVKSAFNLIRKPS